MPNDFRTDMNSSLAIAAPLDCSLWPDKGPMPDFFGTTVTNPGCPTTVDCYGRVKDAVPGEALFYGARRVENLLRFTEHLSYVGGGGWQVNAGAAITPVTDSRRPGSDGGMTCWKLSRFTSINSVIRPIAGIRRMGRPAGLDLLQPVPHVAAVNARRSTTNIVNTAELRVYTLGGATHATSVVNISDALQTFAVIFTPAVPKRIAAFSWASGTLTVSIPAHGLTNTTIVRLSGNLPVSFDIEAAITLVDANTFTMPLASNPGTNTSFGWMQQSYYFGIAADSFNATGLGDVEIEYPYVSEIEGYPQGMICEYVPRNRIPADKYWYGAGVDGVRYLNTAAGYRLDPATSAVARNLGPKLSTTRGITLYTQTQSLIPRKFAELLSDWGKSVPGLGLTDYASRSPMGGLEASRITEGTETGRHYAQLPAGALTAANTANGFFSSLTAFLATPGGTSGRDWACISFIDRAGVEQNAYVNLTTGATGSSTSGVRNVQLEPLATIDGLPYWRVHVQVTTGTGSNAPVIRIGLASANNNNSYAGDGNRYLVCWGVAFVGGNIQRPIAAPYGRQHQETSAILSGAALQYETRGILGYGNITVATTFTPYYKARQVDKFDYAGAVYLRAESPQMISSATAGVLLPVPMERFGIVIRPNASPGLPVNELWAFDHYNGDPNAFYMFKEGGYYNIGDTVIATDTLPNMANTRYMYTVTSVTGPAGTEPVWPIPAVSLPSAPVTSGGVTFQCIHNNGIRGIWEPYNGAVFMPPNDFMAEIRLAFFIGDDDYGAAMNGVLGEKQTYPQPVNPVYRYDMRAPIRTLVVGQLGHTLGVDLQSQTPYIGADGSALMPRHTSFTKNLYVWTQEADPTSLIQITSQQM